VLIPKISVFLAMVIVPIVNIYGTHVSFAARKDGFHLKKVNHGMIIAINAYLL